MSTPIRKLHWQTGFRLTAKALYKKAQKKRTTLFLPSNARQFSNGVKHFPKYLQKRLPKKVAVISISAKESQRLNRLYRKKNKPTNVLSFRYGPEYGEILICPEIVKQEAKAQGNSQEYQMTWMAVHGILHLGGVHHERSAREAKNVEKLEKKFFSGFLDRVKSQISKIRIGFLKDKSFRNPHCTF